MDRVAAVILCCLWTLLISCQSDTIEDSAVPFEPQDTAPPGAFEVTGTVIDDSGSPVSEAMVLVGGRDETMVLTDEQGYFSLWYTDIGLGEPAIVASKAGYRAQGFEFFKPDTPITIKMREVKAPDNLEYTFEDPGDGFNEMEQNCSHCHTDFVADFLDSKHAGAASNPLLHDLYAGITRIYNNESDCVEAGGRWAMGLEPGTEDNAIEKCYLGGGVLPDLNPECGREDAPACDDPDIGEEQAPTAFGACADCHASGINGELGDRNLHDAVGLAYELGVHCDTCHKVKDVDLSQPPGYGKRLVVHRPGEPGRNTFEWDPVYYGPLADVPNVAMGGSPQLKFNESVFCAGCHEQKQEALLPDESLDAEKWPEGLPIHSTYTEWKEGPYNQDATQCQWCHMPADTEKNNSVDISTPYNQSITFGFPREPEDIRQHIFRGPLHGEPRLIDTALHLSLDVKQEANTLAVTASVANIGCGHAIPTGEPMRSLILLVEANGSCGALEATGGLTVNDIGGRRAEGIVSVDVSMTGTTIVWPSAEQAQVGQVIRAVRPSGSYDDYNGIGLFADPARSPEEKGMEIFHPLGEVRIISMEDEQIQVDGTLSLLPGDILYLGDEVPSEMEGADASHFAGHAGYTFARVLLDSQGNRHVPHYKAVDTASDNRIAPGSYSLTQHEFQIPNGCEPGEVQARVLYRPVPLRTATPRGWESKDYIIAQATGSW